METNKGGLSNEAKQELCRQFDLMVTTGEITFVSATVTPDADVVTSVRANGPMDRVVVFPSTGQATDATPKPPSNMPPTSS